eukprot:1360507-Amorphochlora_amoeboformis.AAC.1
MPPSEPDFLPPACPQVVQSEMQLFQLPWVGLCAPGALASLWSHSLTEALQLTGCVGVSSLTRVLQLAGCIGVCCLTEALQLARCIEIIERSSL